MSKDTIEGAVAKDLMVADPDPVGPASISIGLSKSVDATKSEVPEAVTSSGTTCEDGKPIAKDSNKDEVEPVAITSARADDPFAVAIPKDNKPKAVVEAKAADLDKAKDVVEAKTEDLDKAKIEAEARAEGLDKAKDVAKAEELDTAKVVAEAKAEDLDTAKDVAEAEGLDKPKDDAAAKESKEVKEVTKTEGSEEVEAVNTEKTDVKKTEDATEIQPAKYSEAGVTDSEEAIPDGTKAEEPAVAEATKPDTEPSEKPVGPDDGIEIKAEETPEDTLKKVDMQDSVSVMSVAGSSADDSDVTPPVTCFNWFKPQRIMSRLRSKRDKSHHKTDLPSLKSQVSDPNEYSLEGTPGNSKIYSNVFIAVFNEPDEPVEVERIDYSCLAEDKIIPTYLCAHPCYEIMPTSGKVIILSVELLVKNAFSALVSNDIKAAPLWDASYFDFVGMLTISDFINVLRHYYYSSPEDIKDIENQSIATWRRITKVEKPFVKVGATESLFQATKLLIQEGVHRIPVFDEKRQSVLFVLTRKRLLHYLCNSLFENFEKLNARTPNFFRETIGTLKIGTFEDIATVNINTRVIDALDLFVKRNVSSLPVVDKDNILQDIFEKFDVFQLAKEQTYHNLDMEIKEAISKAGVRETAWICSLDETFGTVINRFVNNKVHRIVVIDKDRKVVGIISLSDILKFLAVNPMENEGLPSTTETILEVSEGGAAGGSSLESSQKAADEENAVTEAVSTLKIEEDPKTE